MSRRFAGRRVAIGSVTALLLLCGLGGNAHQAAAPTGYSAPALYNRANAYARTGKPGLAVLNYARARLLDPQDPDIRANLRYVQSSAGLPPAPETRLDSFARLAPPAVFAWLGVAGVVLAGASVLARRSHPKHRRTWGAITMVGVALIGAAACDAAALWPTLQAAVIVAGPAQARVSPVPMGDPVFTLREAEMVRSIARHDSYILVQTAAGRRGWISAESLAPVVPPTR